MASPLKLAAGGDVNTQLIAQGLTPESQPPLQSYAQQEQGALGNMQDAYSRRSVEGEDAAKWAALAKGFAAPAENFWGSLANAGAANAQSVADIAAQNQAAQRELSKLQYAHAGKMAERETAQQSAMQIAKDKAETQRQIEADKIQRDFDVKAMQATSKEEIAAAKRESDERMNQLNNSFKYSMSQLAQSNKPEKMIPILDPVTGSSQLLPQSQVEAGMVPYNASTVKQWQAAKTKETTDKQGAISAQIALDQVDKLYTHPGRLAGTGATAFLSKIPATDAHDFNAELDTFKAQTFVPMVQALKGMGALSDAEGKKLTQAVGALDPYMSEAAFASSLKGIAKELYDKAVASGLNVSKPAILEGGKPSAPALTPITRSSHPEDIQAIINKHK